MRTLATWLLVVGALELSAAAARGDDDKDKPRQVTWCGDVAKIVWSRCAACHRPGEVGPFSLLEYRDAAKRAEFIASVTAERRMPPWHAEPGHGGFLDDARLTDAELETLKLWAATGAAEGDERLLPSRPQFSDGWQLGKPDLVLQMAEPFDVPAEGRDVFRCFVLPTGLAEDRTVAAVEFRPGNRRVVHHALFMLDASGAARKLDESDAGPGYGARMGIGVMPSGSIGGWAPGATPRRLPDGLGKRLPAKADIVLQVHYHPDGKEERDQSELGIYFPPKPAERIVIGLPLVNRQIDIPPGESRHRVTCEFTLPADVEAIGITPHMHYLGREMKTTAYLPDGTERSLIWIKRWDFDWQGQYLYRQPVPLPRGTRLQVEAYYDNSADNPSNPSQPPKRVTFGEQTTNEMCLCVVQFIARERADYVAVMQEVVRVNTPMRRIEEFLRSRLAPAD
jgi:hypothetical protein